MAEETAERSYEHAVKHLRKTHAIFVGKELAIHMTSSVGRYWLEQDKAALQPNGFAFAAPAARLQPETCLIFADGVMIHTDGEWHEARVGTVRSQMPEGGRKKSSIARLCNLDHVAYPGARPPPAADRPCSRSGPRALCHGRS